MKILKRLILFSIIISTVLVPLSACKKKQGGRYFKDGELASFPLKETQELTYWVPLSGSVGVVKDFNEMGMYKELEKLTNVKIKFIHPVQSNVKEQFNIMIASSEYPDIIEGMSNYPGGVSKAYEDGVVVRLNELMDDYTPNLKRIFDEK